MATNSNDKAKRKTRQSSESTNSESASPADKKKKSDLNETVEGDEDEVFQALQMAEEVSKNMEKILQKLEKLDSLEATMLKTMEKVVSIESHITEMGKRLDTLEKKSLDIEETVQNLTASIDFVSNRERDLSDDVVRCHDSYLSLKTKINYLEAYSRRENLIFSGISETQEENIEQVLRSFLSEELRMPDAENIEFQRVHRLGRKKNSTRPIIARFLRYSDRENVATSAYRLKGKNMYVFPDFPKEIQESRKRQLPKLKKAKQEGKTAAFSKSKPDMLYINGKHIPEYSQLYNVT